MSHDQGAPGKRAKEPVPGSPKKAPASYGARIPVGGRRTAKAASVKSDAKTIKKATEIGAKIGGGPIGAADGAAVGAVATKSGRKGLKIGIAAAFVGPPLMMMATIVFVMSMISGSLLVDAGAQSERALYGMTESGVPEDLAEIVSGVATETSVPYEILTAAAYVHDKNFTSVSDDAASDDQVREVERYKGRSYGPYGLIPREVEELIGDEAPTDYGEYLDLRQSSLIYAAALKKAQADVGLEDRDLDMNRGVEVGVDEAETYHNVYQVGTSSHEVAEAQHVRDSWISVLDKMPAADADANAEEIYDTAFTWFLGQIVGCLTSGGIVASGNWTSPVPNSAPAGDDQDFMTPPSRPDHDGVDLNPTPQFGPIYAASGGTVRLSENASYGPHYVEIDHGQGIITGYAHMSSATVTDGQTVEAGAQVGNEGSEGNSTGPHLHFTVTVGGSKVDPVPFMAERGVDLFAPGGNVSNPGGAPPPTVGEGGEAPTGPSTSGDKVRVVQANIPMRHPSFGEAMEKTVASNPDFVSLNEVSRRDDRAITPNGYSSWRGSRAERGADGTAVLWRNDRWNMVKTGRIVMVADGPQQWDHDRAATWVTLESADLGTVSFVSLHHMVNPKKYGPNKPRRQELYRQGLEKVASLVSTLSTSGPVFVAGDFNYQSHDTDSYGPHAILGRIGMKSNHQVLGRVKTHVGGGSIDYVFAQDAYAKATRQWAKNVGSDHLAIGVDYTVTGTGSIASLPETWTGESSSGERVTLDRTQLGFAQKIAAKGAEMGVSDSGIIIAYMTVFVETKFVNYGSARYPETVNDSRVYPVGSIGSDHDSVGLFQQRPQSGWGTPGELLDASYTASAFFGGSRGPNRGDPPGLLDQPSGWETRDKGTVAQAVQRSAFGDKYAHWEQPATELLAVIKAAGLASTGVSECGENMGMSTTGYTVGSFNAEGGGNAADSTGALVENFQAQNVSVVGIQEFSSGQRASLVSEHGELFGVWPRGTADTEVVAWRTSDWDFVEGQSFNIPGPNGGNRRVPAVKLRNKASGSMTWFISVIHFDDSARTNNANNRAAALRIELAKVEALNEDGTEVVLVGDFADVNGPHRVFTPAMTNAFGSGTEENAPPGAVDVQIYHVGSSSIAGGRVAVDDGNPLVVATVSTPLGFSGNVPSSYNLGPVTAKTATMANTLGPMFGIQTIYGIGSRGNASCHPLGMGLDFMVPMTEEGKRQGQALADYAAANADRLGVNWMSWYQRSFSPGRGWSPMEDRGSPTANHMDHVHISVAPCQY